MVIMTIAKVSYRQASPCLGSRLLKEKPTKNVNICSGLTLRNPHAKMKSGSKLGVFLYHLVEASWKQAFGQTPVKEPR